LFILNQNSEVVAYSGYDDEVKGSHLIHGSTLFLEAKREIDKDQIKFSMMEEAQDIDEGGDEGYQDGYEDEEF